MTAQVPVAQWPEGAWMGMHTRTQANRWWCAAMAQRGSRLSLRARTHRPACSSGSTDRDGHAALLVREANRQVTLDDVVRAQDSALAGFAQLLLPIQTASGST